MMEREEGQNFERNLNQYLRDAFVASVRTRPEGERGWESAANLKRRWQPVLREGRERGRERQREKERMREEDAKERGGMERKFKPPKFCFKSSSLI